MTVSVLRSHSAANRACNVVQYDDLTSPEARRTICTSCGTSPPLLSQRPSLLHQGALGASLASEKQQPSVSLPCPCATIIPYFRTQAHYNKRQQGEALQRYCVLRQLSRDQTIRHLRREAEIAADTHAIDQTSRYVHADIDSTWSEPAGQLMQKHGIQPARCTHASQHANTTHRCAPFETRRSMR